MRETATAQRNRLPISRADRHPDRTKRAVALEAVKVGPGKLGSMPQGWARRDYF
jgi:hypothetical protein